MRSALLQLSSTSQLSRRISSKCQFSIFKHTLSKVNSNKMSQSKGPFAGCTPCTHRTVHCADALTWLDEQRSLPNVVTSLPDASEMGMSWCDYKSWIPDVTERILRKLSPGCVAVFYQTDVKEMNEVRTVEYVDKAFLVGLGAMRAQEYWHSQNAMHDGTGADAGATTTASKVLTTTTTATKDDLCDGPPVQLFHRIFLKNEVGTRKFCKTSSYSHMLAFGKGMTHSGSSLEWDCVDADVMHRGDVTWPKGMGFNAALAAAKFVKANAGNSRDATSGTPVTTLCDLFCGEGLLLSVANRLGMAAIGVELSSKRCKKALRMTVSDTGEFNDGRYDGKRDHGQDKRPCSDKPLGTFVDHQAQPKVVAEAGAGPAGAGTSAVAVAAAAASAAAAAAASAAAAGGGGAGGGAVAAAGGGAGGGAVAGGGAGAVAALVKDDSTAHAAHSGQPGQSGLELAIVDPSPEIFQLATQAFSRCQRSSVHGCSLEDYGSEWDAVIIPSNAIGQPFGNFDRVVDEMFNGSSLYQRAQEYIKQTYDDDGQPVGTAFVLSTRDSQHPFAVFAPTYPQQPDAALVSLRAAFEAIRMHNEAVMQRRERLQYQGPSTPIRKAVCPGMGTFTGNLHAAIAVNQMARAWAEGAECC